MADPYRLYPEYFPVFLIACIVSEMLLVIKVQTTRGVHVSCFITIIYILFLKRWL